MKQLYLFFLFCLAFACPAFSQTTWTGTTSNDWNTATNWNSGAVPTATDDVVIPDVAFDPTIGPSTGAIAKSVEVTSGGILTIQSTASLNIKGSKSIGGNATALYNGGTVNNYGQIIIGEILSSRTIGLTNAATFNNNSGSEIIIDNTQVDGLNNSSGTFTNAGKIYIGATGSSGLVGLRNQATFSNNTGGDISIDRSRDNNLSNLSGTFTNAARITIGGKDRGASYGLRNQATFINNTGGEISIDRSNTIALGNQSGSTFTNAARIAIGANTTAGQYGIINNATFSNNAGGEISIDNTSFYGLNNSSGTFTNAGGIAIGANANVGEQGIRNLASFNNNTGGEISIDHTTDVGLFNSGATFNNAARITIGATADVGYFGLRNVSVYNSSTGGYDVAAFNNTAGATLSIDRSSDAGLFNSTRGTFSNAAQINIGSIAPVGAKGLQNDGNNFDNNQGGIIRIDNTFSVGLVNSYSIFNNAAQIIIGSIAAVGSNGLTNINGRFYNNTGAAITIDRSSENGLLNQSGTFTNAARIIIGANAPVGAKGIYNGFIFKNDSGGEISIDNASAYGLYHSQGSFTNAAIIVIGAISSVGETGVYCTNYSSAAFNNSGCGALLKVASNSIVNGQDYFTNSGTIIENASGNSIIGTNTGTVQNLNDGTFTITSNSGVLTTASLGTNWTGCINTDWNTASNWSGFTVPTAADDVIIPSVTNAPVISTTALAHSVEVQTSASLTIQNTGSLTINGATAYISITTSLHNNGTINNSGQISIDAAAYYGLYNKGLVTNHPGGQINIDHTTYRGLFNEQEGTFTNSGNFVIGATASVGREGLYNSGTFNNTGGSIHIDRSYSVGLYHLSGYFNNAGSILIGATASTGSMGIYNGATFNNNTGGKIVIDRSTSYGLYNSNTFTNAASIVIGANASVGQYGFSNSGAFINSACAGLSLFAPLNNTSTFTNQGLMTVSTTLAHSNWGFTNDGVLSYPQGNPIPNVTNNALVVTPTGSCNAAVLQIGGSNHFTVGTTWYTDLALTNAAGTYNPVTNRFVAAGLSTGSTYTLYFSVADVANSSCTQTASISVTVDAPPVVTINPASATLTCANGSATLAASGGVTYLWEDNSTGASRTVSQGGTYTVTATAANGCTAKTSAIVSESFTTVWYLDADNDGYYTGSGVTQCASPGTGYKNTGLTAGGDCDDTKLLYADNDGDGYAGGAPAACGVVTNTDCNDGNAAVRPGAVEICGNNIDDNCNGLTDENCGPCANATTLTTTVNGTSVTLNWVANVNPVQWQVQYKTTSSGSKWVDQLVAGTSRAVSISGLKAKQTYQWHIRAKCGTKWTTYSATMSFKTTVTSLNAPTTNTITVTQKVISEEARLQVRVLPNPSSSYFTLVIQSSSTGAVSMQVVDAVGRAVEGKGGLASNTTLRIGGAYRPGVYYAQVIQDGKLVTVKLLKQ